MKRMLFIILFLCIGVAVIVGCQSASTEDISEGLPEEYADMENPFPVNAIAAGAGETLYEENCQRCHGSDARGEGTALDLVASAESNDDGTLYWWVTTGGGSFSMPAFSSVLSTEEVWQVITYLQYLE